ncbi:hypothetical protein CAC01_28870 [Streptomyces sp. CLI2509]|nr:hypothetical protein CAC01_28870 [Streptomyces sp. CLI2509]
MRGAYEGTRSRGGGIPSATRGGPVPRVRTRAHRVETGQNGVFRPRKTGRRTTVAVEHLARVRSVRLPPPPTE